MSRIELFSNEHCRGVSLAIEDDTMSLAYDGFLKLAKSLRMSGDPWVVFTDAYCKGEFELYREGTYDSIPDFAKKICSLRVVKGGLIDPVIAHYGHCWCGGKQVTVKDEVPSTVPYGMEHKVSSDKVLRGARRIYQVDIYEGGHMVVLAGEKVPDYCIYDWNDKAASLKPYKEY